MWWIRKGKKGEKKRKRGREANKGERRSRIEREGDKGERKKMRIFPVFRRSNPDGPRVKVNPRITGYAWVLISWNFVKIRDVGNFPTWIIFYLKGHLMAWAFFGAITGRVISPKILRLNIENFWDWFRAVPNWVEVWF